MGSVYKRGRIWWIRYSRNGKDFYESSQSRKKTVASTLLKQREGDIADGKPPGSIYAKVRYEDLRQDLITDYALNKRRSITRLQDSLKHLDKHFEGLKGPQITTSRIKAYIKDRLDNGAANGTVNRELAALKRMLKLGYQDNKIAMVPYIPMLEENNVRQGFFEHDEYIELLKALPPYLRPAVMFAYRTGWRKKEILTLTWDKVDLKERTVSLTPGDTKNKNSRLIYLDDKLYDLFRKQNMRRHKGCPFVFHHDGNQIKDIRGGWKNACKKAGIKDKLFHDLRRTAVRNLTRAGVQEAVCMKITGHKTRDVFDRYNIVSQDDLKKAAQKQDAYLS